MSNNLKIIYEKDIGNEEHINIQILRFCTLNNVSTHCLTLFAEFLELNEKACKDHKNLYDKTVLKLIHYLEEQNLALTKEIKNIHH